MSSGAWDDNLHAFAVASALICVAGLCQLRFYSPKVEKDLVGKVAIVTGANSGIGLSSLNLFCFFRFSWRYKGMKLPVSLQAEERR